MLGKVLVLPFCRLGSHRVSEGCWVRPTSGVDLSVRRWSLSVQVDPRRWSVPGSFIPFLLPCREFVDEVTSSRGCS